MSGLDKDRLGIVRVRRYFEMDRRQLLKGAAAIGAAALVGRALPAQAATKLNFVGWEGYDTFLEAKDFVAGKGAELQKSYISSADEVITKLRSRRDLTVQYCGSAPRLSCVPPRAAFYAFPRLEIPDSDEEFVKQLLIEKQVLVVHGSGFGQAPGTKHIRIVFLPNEATLTRAYTAIGEFMHEHYS